MSRTPGFHIGDAVVIKPGVMCPDKPTLSLAGWQGWVTEVHPIEGTLEFKWDSQTLRAIPDAYIRECEIEGLDWETMVLGMEEVLPAQSRDTPQEAHAVYEEIMARHGWDYLADENPGIGEVVGHLGNADSLTYLHTWEEHLEQALRFPFEARVAEMLRRGPVQVGDVVTILGIADVDDLYGILADVRLDRRSYMLPLCDLEAINPSSSNYQPLKDYVVWFANR
jgi:hypothetical protein